MPRMGLPQAAPRRPGRRSSTHSMLPSDSPLQRPGCPAAAISPALCQAPSRCGWVPRLLATPTTLLTPPPGAPRQSLLIVPPPSRSHPLDKLAIFPKPHSHLAGPQLPTPSQKALLALGRAVPRSGAWKALPTAHCPSLASLQGRSLPGMGHWGSCCPSSGRHRTASALLLLRMREQVCWVCWASISACWALLPSIGCPAPHPLTIP